MNLAFRLTACCTATALLLSSCTTSETGKGLRWSSPQACIVAHTAGGAVLGAITGALIGVATGGGSKVAQGAAVGGVGGGALAFAYAWGACFAAFTKVSSVESEGSRKARAQVHYRAEQGSFAKIDKCLLEPAAIAPGDTPTMDASYYVMTPNEENVTVTETVALKVYNPQKKLFDEVGKSSETVVVAPGKRNARSEIPIPPNAVGGEYFIAFRVQMQGRSDEKQMPLTITNDPDILAKAKTAATRGVEQPGGAEAATQVAANNGSKEIAAKIKEIVITVSKANLRQNPDQKAKVVAKASEGNRFALLTSIKVNGKQWHQIRLQSGEAAWITASTCKVTE